MKEAKDQQKVSLIFYSEEDGKRAMMDKWGIEIGKKYTIGRSKKKVDISIQDTTISRMQAEFIFYDKDKIMIRDLNSSNGTYINKERLEPLKERYFSIKDVISIGDEKNELIFEVPKEIKKIEEDKKIREDFDDKNEKENKKNEENKKYKINENRKNKDINIKKNSSESFSKDHSYKRDKYDKKDKYDRDYKYERDYKYDKYSKEDKYKKSDKKDKYEIKK